MYDNKIEETKKQLTHSLKGALSTEEGYIHLAKFAGEICDVYSTGKDASFLEGKAHYFADFPEKVKDIAEVVSLIKYASEKGDIETSADATKVLLKYSNNSSIDDTFNSISEDEKSPVYNPSNVKPEGKNNALVPYNEKEVQDLKLICQKQGDALEEAYTVIKRLNPLVQLVFNELENQGKVSYDILGQLSNVNQSVLDVGVIADESKILFDESKELFDESKDLLGGAKKSFGKLGSKFYKGALAIGAIVVIAAAGTYWRVNNVDKNIFDAKKIIKSESAASKKQYGDTVALLSGEAAANENRYNTQITLLSGEALANENRYNTKIALLSGEAAANQKRYDATIISMSKEALANKKRHTSDVRRFKRSINKTSKKISSLENTIEANKMTSKQRMNLQVKAAKEFAKQEKKRKLRLRKLKQIR